MKEIELNITCPACGQIMTSGMVVNSEDPRPTIRTIGICHGCGDFLVIEKDGSTRAADLNDLAGMGSDFHETMGRIQEIIKQNRLIYGTTKKKIQNRGGDHP